MSEQLTLTVGRLVKTLEKYPDQFAPLYVSKSWMPEDLIDPMILAGPCAVDGQHVTAVCLLDPGILPDDERPRALTIAAVRECLGKYRDRSARIVVSRAYNPDELCEPLILSSPVKTSDGKTRMALLLIDPDVVPGDDRLIVRPELA